MRPAGGVSGDLTQKLLIEYEPGLGHPDRDHRNPLVVRHDLLHGNPDLGYPVRP